MGANTKHNTLDVLEFKCPVCLNWVVPIDLLEATGPQSKHEFIYGACQCPACNEKLDWLSFHTVEGPRFKQ